MKSLFNGLNRLFGHETLAKLQKSHVAVIGVGGVGSWCAEGLVRSGLGEITLIDLDEVCISNTNRQLTALHSTVGQMKVQVLKDRFIDISPQLRINAVEDFLTESTKELLTYKRYDYIIDAIDSVENKCLLIRECQKFNLPLLTIGASAGKYDPTTIEISDITLTSNDSLLSSVRKKLRREYNFPRDKSTWNIKAVYSRQRAQFLGANGDMVFTAPAHQESKKLDCSGAMGSSMFMTAPMGLAATSVIVQELLKK